jgi:hypothetical protein
MTSHSGPIYEVTFFMDRDIADDFDRWLEEHVRDARNAAGVGDCNTCAMADDDGRSQRLCLYRLTDDEAFDAFLEGFGGNVDNEVAERFGKRVELHARVLREDTRQDLSGGSPDCLNCGAYLRGQYCAVCGQRARSRLISLWELVTDAFGDLFELDSRLWQTVVPLLVRPGRLTHDYLQGRRARYMPPFRMYLVLSVLFFVVAFFDPREDLSLLYEPEPPVASETNAGQPAADAGDVDSVPADDAGTEAAEPAPKPNLRLDVGSGGLNINFDKDAGAADDCTVEASGIEDLPVWLQRRLTPQRLRTICEHVRVDDGRAFFDKVLDNVPTALIVLLPLMAFVLSVLYPLSRRYYVEHLLFFVHFHAFFFLVLTLQILLARIGGWLNLPETLPTLGIVAASFYVPVYLFVAMRRVYGQGRFVTLLKYVVLLIAYVLGFTATMLGAMAIAALSV